MLASQIHFDSALGSLSAFARAYPLPVVLALLLLYLLRVRYRSGLRNVPGPFLASITSLWKLNIVRNEDMPWTSIRAHKKYGPMVRIGPNHVSIAHPDAIKIIYGNESKFRKTKFYSTAQARYEGENLDNMFATSDIAFHNRIKRTTGHVYSTTAVSQLEPQVDSCLELFLSRIRAFATSMPQPMDMSAWLQFYSFDCLGAISFSQKLGFLATGTDVDNMILAVDQIFDYVARVGQIPILDRFLLGNPLLRYIKPRAQESGGILRFTIDMIHQHRAKPIKRNDILTRLFDIHESDPERLSFKEMVGAMSINVFAGHDALAITMRTCLYHLCKNHGPYKEVTREVRAADAAGTLSKQVSYSEATSLQYLSAVVWEAIRIHPPVGLILERHVPKGGVDILGVHLPEDTVVGTNAWVLHRDKEIFGEDVEAFRPERWIEFPADQVRDMRKNIFTFGAGSHACVGRGIALLELFKVIAEICRNFDFRLTDPAKEWHVQGTWVTKQTNMDMLFSPVSRVEK